MQYFNTSSDINEHRLIYRRLAMLNHPDMGGNPEVMKRINIEYDEIKRQYSITNIVFEYLCVGDTIVINKSLSTVTAISSKTFTARSEYSQRYAVFSKSTGICIDNPKFKAIVPNELNYAE
ncbi:MAG: hypothetical protein QM503_13155 [Bacteroidota bacterium]